MSQNGQYFQHGSQLHTTTKEIDSDVIQKQKTVFRHRGKGTSWSSI